MLKNVKWFQIQTRSITKEHIKRYKEILRVRAGCELQSAMDDLEKQAKGSLEHDLVSWMTINLQGSILPGFPEESLTVV